MAPKRGGKLTESGQDETEDQPMTHDDFLSMPSSKFAHQDMCDRITKSVAEISYHNGKYKSLVPGVILEIEQGSYCILFECGIMWRLKIPSFEIRFLNGSEIVKLSSAVLESHRVDIFGNYISLAAFSYNTAPNCLSAYNIWPECY
ncbi:hypothetical protein VPH35_091936 [Triticum aestivum]